MFLHKSRHDVLYRSNFSFPQSSKIECSGMVSDLVDAVFELLSVYLFVIRFLQRFLNSFSARTKLVAWSLRISLTGFPHLMRRLPAGNNEAVSMECDTSVCVAGLAMHVNKESYLLNFFLPCLTYQEL